MTTLDCCRNSGAGRIVEEKEETDGFVHALVVCDEAALIKSTKIAIDLKSIIVGVMMKKQN